MAKKKHRQFVPKSLTIKGRKRNPRSGQHRVQLENLEQRIVLATYSDAILADGPAAYFRLDDAGATAADSTSNGLDGTYLGGVTLGQSGVSGDLDDAAIFNGADAKVDVPYNAGLNPAGDFTVELWARVDGGGGHRSPITSRDDIGAGADTRGYILYADPSNVWQFWTGTGGSGGSWDVLGGPAVTVGAWTHFVLSFETDGTGRDGNGVFRGTKTMYVNGVQAAQAANSPYEENLVEALHIGAGADTGNNFFFNGAVDDVAIYGSALSAVQVQAHFAASLASDDDYTITNPTTEDQSLDITPTSGVLSNDFVSPIVSFDATSANGAAVTVNADGGFSYDPTGSATLQALNDGDALTDTFTYTIADSPSLVTSFDEGALDSRVNLDVPNPALADITFDAANEELDFNAAGSTNLWTDRADAPIAWAAQPSVAVGETWVVETEVRLNDIAQNQQVAGITFYGGPDGAKPDFGFGLDNWNPAARAVRLQGLGDNNPNVGVAFTGDSAFLRVEVTENGGDDSYNFFFKDNAGDVWSQLDGVANNFSSDFANSQAGLFYKTGGAKAGAAFTQFKVFGPPTDTATVSVRVNGLDDVVPVEPVEAVDDPTVIKLDFSSAGDGDGGSVADWNQFLSIGTIPAGSVIRHGSGEVVDGVSVTFTGAAGFNNDGNSAGWPGTATDPYYIGAADDLMFHNGTSTVTFAGLDDAASYNLRVYSLINTQSGRSVDVSVTDGGGAITRENLDRQVTWDAVPLTSDYIFEGISTDGGGNIILNIDADADFFVLNALVLEINPYGTNEDALLTIPDGGSDLLANDSPTDSTLVSFDATSANGAAVTVNADGGFSYDPTGSAILQALNDGEILTDTFTYTIADSASLVTSFDEGALDSRVNLDVPNPGLADITFDAANEELDFNATGNTDMWTVRNNAPIAWAAQPSVAVGETWVVETEVRLNDIAENQQVAGITFYGGPDGARPDFSFGLDNWNPAARAVRLQGLGDNNPNVGVAFTGDSAFLRVEVTENGGGDSYNFFFKDEIGDPWSQLAGVANNFSSSFANTQAGLFYKTGGAKAGAAFTQFKVFGPPTDTATVSVRVHGLYDAPPVEPVEAMDDPTVIKLDFSSAGDGDGGSVADWNQITSIGTISAGSVIRHGTGEVVDGVSVIFTGAVGFNNDGNSAGWPGTATDPYYIGAADDLMFHNGTSTVTFAGLDDAASYNLRVYSLINTQSGRSVDVSVTDGGGAITRENLDRQVTWDAVPLTSDYIFEGISTDGGGNIVLNIDADADFFVLNALVLEINPYGTDEDTVLTIPDGGSDLLANDSPSDPTLVSFDATSVNGAAVTVNADGGFSYDPTGSAAIQALGEGAKLTDTFTYTITESVAPANGRFIMVQNNGTTTRRMDIGEVEAFAPGVTPVVDNAGGSGALNPAIDLATAANGASLHSKGATSGFTQPHGTDDDPNLIDGAETVAGNTWSSEGVGNFVIIDLGQNRDVETIRVHQRNDGCCQDRLQDFTVSLLADDGAGNPGAVVQSAIFSAQPPNNSFAEVILAPVAGGQTDTATVSIQVTGVNDAPNAGDDANSITELVDDITTPNAVTGNLFSNDMDIDDDSDSFQVTMVIAGGTPDTSGASVGNYGTLTWTPAADGNGNYSYALDDANATVQALLPGQTLSEVFTYTMSDNHVGGNVMTDTADLVITIRGVNDSPTATDNTAAVSEDATLTDAGNLITDDDGGGVDSDPDQATGLLSVSAVDGETDPANDLTGAFGTLDWEADGSYTYTLDNANPAVQALAAGETATDTFTYTVNDSAVASANGRFIMVQNNGTTARRMDIGEIEVFAPGVTPVVDNAGGSGALNPAIDLATAANGASLHSKGASSGFSQPHGADDDPRLIDGAETAGGNTWSSDGVGNFVIIDLGQNRGVETIRVHQRNDGCCQDRLADFTVSLLADDGAGNPGAVVQSVVFSAQPPDNSFAAITLAPLSIAATDTATLTVIIPGDDEAATAADDTGSANEDGPAVTIDVLANDSVTNVVSVDITGTIGSVTNHGANVDYDPNGMFESLAVGETATDSFTYTAEDNRGQTASATVTVTVTGANDAPTPNAGGPYTIDEGQGLTLDGSASFDIDANTVLTYRWDVDGDGDYDENVSGVAPSLTPARMTGLGLDDGPSTRAITLEVSDGLVSRDTQTTLTINNVAPIAGIAGATSGVPIFPIDFTFTASNEPSAADEAAGFAYEVVWGDGQSDFYGPGEASVINVQHGFPMFGTFDVTVTVFDKDNASTTAAQTVRIEPVAQIGDDLYVGGTDQVDDRIILQSAGRNQLFVRYNDTRYGGFDISPTSTVIVFTGGGDDRVSVASCINTEMHGGEGNDSLYGGKCNDVVFGGPGRDTILVGDGDNWADGGDGNDRIVGRSGDNEFNGGSGNDTITGGSGQDILRGDAGNDRIVGGFGGDLLIGGAGNDTLFGQGSADVLIGGDGNDHLRGGEDDDLLLGGAGLDRLLGERGGDVLAGGDAANEADDAALLALLASWTSSRDRSPLGELTDDGERDAANGGGGGDEFYAGAEDAIYQVRGNDVLFSL